jgi:hypothetical protein
MGWVYGKRLPGARIPKLALEQLLIVRHDAPVFTSHDQSAQCEILFGEFEIDRPRLVGR